MKDILRKITVRKRNSEKEESGRKIMERRAKKYELTYSYFISLKKRCKQMKKMYFLKKKTYRKLRKI